MRIDIKEIENGSYNGEYVYICDYRIPTLDEKAIRHIKPQKVLVNVDTSKTDGYSHSYLDYLERYRGDCFKVVGKNGKVLKKSYKIYDNTAFPTPLNVFTTFEECEEFYKDQCKVIKENLEGWYIRKTAEYKHMKQQLLNVINEKSL